MRLLVLLNRELLVEGFFEVVIAESVDYGVDGCIDVDHEARRVDQRREPCGNLADRRRNRVMSGSYNVP